MSEIELSARAARGGRRAGRGRPAPPEFVRAVLDAVEAGDNEAARALVEPLHPADIADLFELTPQPTAPRWRTRSPTSSTATSSPR